MSFFSSKLFLILVFLLFFFSFGCIEEKKVSTDTVRLSVSIKDSIGDTWFSGSSDFNKGLNAFDAMKSLVGDKNISYESYDFGVFIKGFMNRETPSNYFWSLSVNGVPAEKGISGYSLDFDTNIDWTLEKIESYSS